MLAPSMLAKAKINLYLHVAAPDTRGYHPLRSMVVFADIGDELQLIFGGKGRLRIDGPYAEGLSADEDNLVMKAVRLFEQEVGKQSMWDYRLTKNLPLASGIGGGSADAGAILHLLSSFKPDMPDEALSAIAARTGADGVMCLWSKPCIAEGYGEKLSPIVIPPLPCVLINPGVECPTPDVFHTYDEAGMFQPVYTRWVGEGIIPHDAYGRGKVFMTNAGQNWSVGSVIEYLTTTRNDLEAPAIKLKPVIGDVLAALRAEPETLFARMSGSGATCFALCDTKVAADVLADRLRKDWPKAWVRSCTLN